MIFFKHIYSQMPVGRKRALVSLVVAIFAITIFSFASGRPTNAESISSTASSPVGELSTVFLADRPKFEIDSTSDDADSEIPNGGAVTMYAVSNANRLLRFSSATPGTIASDLLITGLGAGESIHGVDIRPATGQLYALAIADNGATRTGRLYILNQTTAVATAVGAAFSTTLSDTEFWAMDFNPVNDRLRVVNANGQNLRINPNNGALAGTDTNTSATGIEAIAHDYDVAGGLTTLFAYNFSVDDLARIGGVDGNPSPNGGVVTNIGSSGLFAFGPQGMDIETETGIARFSASVGSIFRLYTINLSSGTATLVGAIGGGTVPIRGLTSDSSIVYLNGTAGADTINLVRSGADVTVTGATGGPITFPLTDLTRIIVNGLDGADQVTLDFSNGSLGPVTVNGGNPTTGSGDSLRMVGGNFATGQSNPINGHDGSMVYTGGTTGSVTIDYTGLEPIDDLNIVTNYTINATNGLNFINIVNGPIILGTQTTQVNDGAVLFELINFANKTNVTINALNGSDQIAFNNNLEGVGLASLIVNGGNGDDQFNINGPGTVAGTAYTISGGPDNDLFSVSGGLLLAPITINGDANTGVTASTSDRLTVNSFASNVTQSNTQLQFSGGSTITFGTAEQINLNNLNTLSVSGTAAADTLVLSKPSSTTYRSILNGGIEVNFEPPAAAVGSQYFANPAGESDIFTIDNTGRVVNLRVGYNAGAGTLDTLNVFGDPGPAVARESFLAGATQDAGRFVLDPDGSMGFLKTSSIPANGDELDISINGLEAPIATDVQSSILDVALSNAADNATVRLDGTINGSAAMIVADNAATFSEIRFANKAAATVSGFIANDIISVQPGSIAASITSLGFNGFLPFGLGVDDNPASSTNRDIVNIAESIAAVRNLTFDYSETVSRLDVNGFAAPLRIDTAETVNYAGTAANNDSISIVDKTAAVDPSRVFALTASGASYTRNGGVGSNGEVGPDLVVSGVGGSSTPLTVDGDAPTTFPGDRFFYDGPATATVTPTAVNAGNITSAGLIGVHFQNYERLTTGGSGDLSLTKTVNNPSPAVGGNVTFTITLTNSGPNAANLITAQDILPAGLTFVSSSATQGTYSNATGNWTVGTIASGSSATLQITATAATTGAKVNYAQVMASSVADADSTPGDNSTNQDDDDSVTVTPAGPTPTPTSTPTNTPTATPTATPTSTPTATPTSTPTATPTPGGGFEGDVAPRPNGNSEVLANDIVQLRRFAAGLDTPDPTTNENQRADAAPRASGGDGVISSADVVQGRRYAASLDPLTNAGGPTAPSLVPESVSRVFDEIKEYFFGREITVVSQEAEQGTQVTLPVALRPFGDETAMSFTLEYDPDVLGNPRVTLGEFAPPGSTLTFNTNENGRIGILIDSTEPMTASAMPKELLTVTFDVVADKDVSSPIALTSSLAAQGVSDAMANPLPTRFVDGNVMLRQN